MRVVVVGASGNVGTAVVQRLKAAPEVTEIVGIVRHVPHTHSPDTHVPGGHIPDATPDGPYDGVRWHGVDVGAPGAVRTLTPAFAGADAVIHLAWLLQPNHDEAVMARTNITGLANVLDAVRAAAVPQIVVASSVGAYSPGPKHRAVDESWPVGGIHTSHYAKFKAANERMLTVFEDENPGTIVTRMRPGLVMQHDVGAELKRLFLGPLIPTGWLATARLPIVPLPRRAISQVVHADDLADAFWRAIDRRAGGAFNIATLPVVDPALVAGLLGGRPLPIRAAPVRALLDLAWRLRLVPVDPGWLDIAVTVPVMSTDRARDVLGWTPRIDARAALRAAIDGVAAASQVADSPRLRR